MRSMWFSWISQSNGLADIKSVEQARPAHNRLAPWQRRTSRGARRRGVDEEQLGDAAHGAENPQVDDAPREGFQVRPPTRRSLGHGQGRGKGRACPSPPPWSSRFFTCWISAVCRCPPETTTMFLRARCVIFGAARIKGIGSGWTLFLGERLRTVGYVVLGRKNVTSGFVLSRKPQERLLSVAVDFSKRTRRGGDEGESDCVRGREVYLRGDERGRTWSVGRRRGGGVGTARRSAHRQVRESSPMRRGTTLARILATEGGTVSMIMWRVHT